MLYSEKDILDNRSRRNRMLLHIALIAMPALIAALIGAARRIEPLCTGGLVIVGALLIFFWDLRLKPVVHYGRYLNEISEGLSRKTAGQLVSVGADPVYMDGVWFYEAILNIYEDLSEEGERRFLLDSAKTIPQELVGRDVALTSHGNYVLGVCALEEAHA